MRGRPRRKWPDHLSSGHLGTERCEDIPSENDRTTRGRSWPGRPRPGRPRLSCTFRTCPAHAPHSHAQHLHRPGLPCVVCGWPTQASGPAVEMVDKPEGHHSPMQGKPETSHETARRPWDSTPPESSRRLLRHTPHADRGLQGLLAPQLRAYPKSVPRMFQVKVASPPELRASPNTES